MLLGTIDIAIILIYLSATVFIGLWVRKRANRSKEAYLLGGKTLPWYLLGLSNASGMFDISGTMWLVAIGFIYGLKSIFLPWLWPVFNQVFLMVYLSMWLRRSNATTGAEWMATRFGSLRDAKKSHVIVVVFALISCLGFLAYGFIGLGKFIEIFIPWEMVSRFIPFVVRPEHVPHVYGIVFTLFAVFYTVLGGMTSIVWADLIQYIIMTVSAIVIGVIAMRELAGTTLNVPDGWLNPLFGWKLNLDWRGIIDEVNEKIRTDGYSLFSIFFMMMLFKGILVSIAGPLPNYDMQKILSTRSPSDAAKMSGFVSVILMPVRYIMITGFVVLGLLYYDKLDLIVGNRIDFEQILPSAISQFVPVGLLGLLLAGLLAAFMSTFAGTLNAAQAYLTNDIYLKYMKPKANNRQIRNVNYLAGITTVIISIIFGFYSKDVNSLLQWIVSALWGAYLAANLLKWHWWRFNGNGFFWGMIAGMIPALVFPSIFSKTLDLYYFPLILVISVVGCIAGTFTSPPTDEETLKSFYRTVNPWGFWKPIREKVMQEDPEFIPNKSLRMDIFNIAVGTIGQTFLVLAPMYLVLRKNGPLFITLAVITVCVIIMKRTWWDRLPKDR
ncbi:MAG: Na+:solute symporter [Bacteroidales bacterium]|nr:Na+:solute symporter [Bacteroidales bacterium]